MPTVQRKPKTPPTHRRQDNAKRLTEGEKLLIHTERVKSTKTTRQIAKEYGVSNATVTALEHDERLKVKLAHADHIKKALSAESYIIAEAAGSRVLQDMHRASAYQAAGIRHYAIEDARLVEGSSTQNISVRTVVNDLEARKKELLDSL